MTLALRILERLWLPILLVWLWWVVSASSTSVFLPPLSQIFDVLVADGLNGVLVSHVGASVLNLLLGLTIAIVLGVVVGVLIGESPVIRDTLDPLVHFFRALPQSAIVPLTIGALGIGMAPKIATIAFACVWPVLIASIDGVRGVEPALRDMSRAYRLPSRLHFRRVVFQAALPQIMGGIKVAVPVGVVIMVVSELFAAEKGIGYYILSSASVFRMPEAWAGAVVVGVIGYAASELFRLADARVLRTHHRALNANADSRTTSTRRK